MVALPVPVRPEEIESHPELLAAVQRQESAVVIATVPIPPLLPIEWDVAESAYSHGMTVSSPVPAKATIR